MKYDYIDKKINLDKKNNLTILKDFESDRYYIYNNKTNNKYYIKEDDELLFLKSIDDGEFIMITHDNKHCRNKYNHIILNKGKFIKKYFLEFNDSFMYLYEYMYN